MGNTTALTQVAAEILRTYKQLEKRFIVSDIREKTSSI